MGQGCANCDSLERVEMHHIKHIKTINPRLSPFDKLMARINRKQVPLCRSCHLKVHLGTYVGLPLKHFYYIPFQGEAKWSVPLSIYIYRERCIKYIYILR